MASRNVRQLRWKRDSKRIRARTTRRNGRAGVTPLLRYMLEAPKGFRAMPTD